MYTKMMDIYIRCLSHLHKLKLPIDHVHYLIMMGVVCLDAQQKRKTNL